MAVRAAAFRLEWSASAGEPDCHLQSVRLLLGSAIALPAVGRPFCRRLSVQHIDALRASESERAGNAWPLCIRLHVSRGRKRAAAARKLCDPDLDESSDYRCVSSTDADPEPCRDSRVLAFLFSFAAATIAAPALSASLTTATLAAAAISSTISTTISTTITTTTIPFTSFSSISTIVTIVAITSASVAPASIGATSPVTSAGSAIVSKALAAALTATALTSTFPTTAFAASLAAAFAAAATITFTTSLATESSLASVAAATIPWTSTVWAACIFESGSFSELYSRPSRCFELHRQSANDNVPHCRARHTMDVHSTVGSLRGGSSDHL